MGDTEDSPRLPLFSHDPWCTKCWTGQIRFEYLATPERMKLQCSRCGYTWHTQCADA